MSNSDRNAIRRQLLANGYEPLPLNGKSCYVKGWSFVEIDEDFLKEHARKAAWLNTGIRCGNVVGVDIDIDDAELAAEAEAIVEKILGPTPFCRFGKGEKRLLVYWNDEPIPKRQTARFTSRNEEDAYRIEILGKGCQFAAFGNHPDTGRAYEWPDASPLTDDVDALPAVEPAQLEALVEALESWLESKGFERKAPGNVGDPGSNHDYCLTDDMEFEVTNPGMGLMTVAELKEQLQPGETWECNLTAIRPDSDSEAGRIHWAPSGRFCIVDFARGVTYFETLGLDEMGEVLDRLLTAPPNGGMFGPSPETTQRALVDTYFFLEEDNTVRRLDAPHDAVPFSHFCNSRGRRAVQNWLADPRTRKARHMQFRPDRPAGLFTEGGETLINAYVPPAHPEDGGETATFHTFFAHLVPDAAERALGLDWIASKVQRPWIPGHGLIMVSPRTYGTGRGTLAKILARLLGYHREISFRRITGQEYQSQYNDYLSGTLLVSVPEALDSLDYASRRNAYEALKELVEPSARPIMITRKGAQNRTEMVYASFFFATNHGDALPIDEGDRRFLVLGNGRPLEPDHAQRVYDWMARAENIGALWREMRARKIAYDPLGAAPATAAKARMVEASTSDISHAWADFAASAPGAVATFDQWRSYALSRREELDYPRDVSRRDEGFRRVFRDNTETLGRLVKWQGRPVRPRIIRDFDAWRAATNEALRAELDKNENAAPAGGNVVPFGR